MPDMKISVITVCFNSGRTIGETLRSVRLQTHPLIEQVVVDGGSTDDTLAVVAREGLPGLQLVSGPDRGIYDAMNKGLALATGEVLVFLNSDDQYASPDVLAHVAQALRADAGLDAILGDVVFVDPSRPGKLVRRYRSGRFRPSLLAWGWMPAHPALFVRRRVFERVGNFRTDLRIAGDYDWIVRAFGSGALRYRHLDEVMVRMRTGGVSTGGWRNTLLLNQEVLRACRDNGIRTNWCMLLSKYPAKLLEFVRS
jgi:glycosyltransferase involved in cell wall biosynthesis